MREGKAIILPLKMTAKEKEAKEKEVIRKLYEIMKK
jgi:hypothetical protein